MTTFGQPPAHHEQQFDLDAVFDAAGGGSGAPSFQWPEDANRNPQVGASISGTITDIFVTVVRDAQTKQPKVNKAGRQMPQVNITLQTDLRNWQGVKRVPLNNPDDPNSGPKPPSEDTGERRIYVKYRMLDALAKAIKESSQGGGGPRKGARCAVRVSGLQQTSYLNPLADYQAKYEPPAPTDAAWEQATSQPQAPQQQSYTPPPATPPANDPWSAANSEPPF